jgi:16S rRNA (guanine966-N2)-methyltransferase
MRIIAGTHRGRQLETPADRNIRPTADRVREALFSSLVHRLGGLSGKRVLDAFAGTGALGFEALSRGAARAAFMDKDRNALALCRRNADNLGLGKQSDFHPADATKPPKADLPCDLILLDPPYGQGLGALALSALAEAGGTAGGIRGVGQQGLRANADYAAGALSVCPERYLIKGLLF